MDQLQVWVLGVIVSLVVLPIFALIEKLVTKLNKNIPFDLGKGLKTATVILLSGLLAGMWFPNLVPDLPALKVSFTDLATFFKSLGIIWAWFTATVTALTPFVGAATIIYNVILEKISNKEKRIQLGQAWSNFWK